MLMAMQPSSQSQFIASTDFLSAAALRERNQHDAVDTLKTAPSPEMIVAAATAAGMSHFRGFWGALMAKALMTEALMSKAFRG